MLKKEENLLNATEFARLCGVSAQTILNWVKSGKLVPVSVQGRYNFFSRKQFYDVQVELNQYNRSFAGLALIFGSEDEMSTVKNVFIDAVTNLFGSAYQVNDLDSALDSAVSDGEFEGHLDLREIILESAHKYYRKEMLHYAADIIDANSCLRDEGLYNVIDIAFGRSSLSFEGYMSVVSGFQSLYLNVIRKFGVGSLLNCCGYGAEDLFNGSFDSARITQSHSGVVYDAHSTEACAIWEKAQKNKFVSNSRTRIRKLFSDGYYSVKECGSGLDSDIADDMEYAVVHNYYDSVFVNDFSKLPSGFSSTLRSLSRCGRINLFDAV